MLYFSYEENCSLREVNHSVAAHDRPYVEQEYFLMLWIIPICVVAGMANALSLLVFLRQTFYNKAVQFNLIGISLAEVFLQSSVVLEAVIVLSRFEHRHTLLSYSVTTLTHIYINTCFCVRNWHVLLLAVSRCEVIFQPFATRRKLFFSKRKLQVSQCSIVVVSVALSVVYNLQYRGVVCGNVNGLVVERPLLDNFSVYRYFGMYGLFMFQACVPLVCIWVATVAMVVKLRQNPVLNLNDSPHLPGIAMMERELPTTRNSLVVVAAQQQQRRLRSVTQTLDIVEAATTPPLPLSTISLRQLQVNSTTARPRATLAGEMLSTQQVLWMRRLNSVNHSQSHQFQPQNPPQPLFVPAGLSPRNRTGYLVLALSLVFCLLQMPTFVVTCVTLFATELHFTIHPDVFTNTLSMIDSLLNFFIYAASSAGFRRAALRLFQKKPVSVIGSQRQNGKTTVLGQHDSSGQLLPPLSAPIQTRTVIRETNAPVGSHMRLVVTADEMDEEQQGLLLMQMMRPRLSGFRGNVRVLPRRHSDPSLFLSSDFVGDFI